MVELQLDRELWRNIVLWMKPKYSPGTIRNRSLFLKNIFKEYKVLNPETLKVMMQKFKHQHQRACLTMINDYCYDTDIEFNIKIPSIKAQAKKLPTILSPGEVRVMIASAPKPYDLALRCIFNMGAGLRVSEIIKLSWNHIRWTDWIRNKDSYGVAMIKSGKGSKDRPVNIPKKLMHDLYEYAKEKRVLNEFSLPSGGMIFPFDEGSDKLFKQELMAVDIEKWKEEYVKSRYDWFRYNIIEKCCEKALNKQIHVHQLRHSRATYLHEIEKVPIEKIQVLLGHKNLSTTMIYTKINPRSVFDSLKETEEI